MDELYGRRYARRGGAGSVQSLRPDERRGHLDSGTAALTTDCTDVDCQTHLYRGGWWDSAHILWDEFESTGRLTPMLEPSNAAPQGSSSPKRKGESGALCLRAKLAPGEEHTF